MSSHYRVAVLISGNGSNLQAIIDKIKSADWPIVITAVISDNPQAFGIERAKQSHIPTQIFEWSYFANKKLYHEQLRHYLDDLKIDLIVLAGYMRILDKEFVEHYAGKIINIHPSLLPAYKGLHTHRRVLEAKEKEHGITIHYVTPELDEGPIICQKKLTVSSGETEKELIERIHRLEHQWYPEVIYELATKKFYLDK